MHDMHEKEIVNACRGQAPLCRVCISRSAWASCLLKKSVQMCEGATALRLSTLNCEQFSAWLHVSFQHEKL